RADRPRRELAPQQHRRDLAKRGLLRLREVDPAVLRDELVEHRAAVPRLLVTLVIDARDRARPRLGEPDDRWIAERVGRKLRVRRAGTEPTFGDRRHGSSRSGLSRSDSVPTA